MQPQPDWEVPPKVYLNPFCKTTYAIISFMPVHRCDSYIRSYSFHGMPMSHPLWTSQNSYARWWINLPSALLAKYFRLGFRNSRHFTGLLSDRRKLHKPYNVIAKVILISHSSFEYSCIHCRVKVHWSPCLPTLRFQNRNSGLRRGFPPSQSDKSWWASRHALIRQSLLYAAQIGLENSQMRLLGLVTVTGNYLGWLTWLFISPR